VAIPVLFGKRRFYLDKGRSWSVVEHLILAALSSEPQTAAKLAVDTQLPRRLIVEAIIRLMRAGWIEFSEEVVGIVFRANEAGKSVADRDELPSEPKRIARVMSFIIDRVTGTVFRRRELPFFEKHVLEKRAKQERIVWVEPREIDIKDQVHGLVSTLFDQDERFVSMEHSGDRLVDRFVLFSARNGKAEGLPVRAPAELAIIVQRAAENAPPTSEGATVSSYRLPPITAESDEVRTAPRSIAFSSDDLILDADQHRDLFNQVIKNCRHQLIVHSTFISEDRFNHVKPLLHAAIQRGVLVHVLWGEDDDRTQMSATRRSVGRLREQIASAGLENDLQIHPFSTRSHAKLIVADTGRSNSHLAVVGSCNWFVTDFGSFEASMRIRDPLLVADVVDQFAELSRGLDGHWTDATNYFARLGSDIRRETAPSGARAEANLVLGPDHAAYVRQARDTAERRLFVTSHRLGAAGRPAVVLPAVAAATARDIECKIFLAFPQGLATVPGAPLFGLFRDEIQTELFAHHAGEEPAHGMLLPACRCHDGGDRGALGLPEQGNDRVLLGISTLARF
jgi:cardiolipin synthase